ncbi:hypothetical protein ACPCC5_23845 [Streptomyces pseudogriseolus]|uniref:Integral membrane protein n=2 Tax=Streptomyces pseudogriseolus TaxID=36817 RepID=M3DLC2_STREZ|nr:MULTISPECIES: hypothetical protein [Streptomyces]EMF22382.1 integral membrane protein [Streptomyces gancidicus BKS 13-15]
MSLGDDTGRTRTRLPEGSGDPYGGARRNGRSSSRSLVTVVGVVVLLIAAIAFANRGGGDSDGEEGADSPKAAATAPSGEKPVSAGAAGIPAGFAHDRQGAESAAANYSVVLGSAEMFDKERRRDIVAAVFTPDVAAARQGDLDAAYSNEEFLANIGLDKNGKAPAGQTFVSRVVPVGTKVTAFGADDASVEVWYTSLFGLSGEGSTNPVIESWYTTTYQLQWIDNDWKVVDFQQKDGPVPVGRDQKASTADDMTKAVEEYGGFTYAR